MSEFAKKLKTVGKPVDQEDFDAIIDVIGKGSHSHVFCFIPDYSGDAISSIQVDGNYCNKKYKAHAISAALALIICLIKNLSDSQGIPQDILMLHLLMAGPIEEEGDENED